MSRRPVQDIQIWSVQDRRSNKRYARPWIVRWGIDGRTFQRGHKTRVEADHYRSQLLVSQRDGLRFDLETGEPETWASTDSDLQVHKWVQLWLEESWEEWQPRTRASAVEALCRFVPLTAPEAAPDRTVARKYIKASLQPGVSGDPKWDAWLDRWCPTLGELDRRLLARVDADLGIGAGGQPLGPSTAGRFRKIARSCVRRAVELELIEQDPWPPTRRGAQQRKVRRKKGAVEIRSLPDPPTMLRAIDAMVSHQAASKTYRLMTLTLYLAGLRPSEAVMLRREHLDLPQAGWGAISVVEADISFDEPGEPKSGPRSVPIPPSLVRELADWVATNCPEPCSHLFRTRNGRRPTASNWSRSWHRGLREIEHAPLRLYDCRHAAATTWLSAGVPLGEVARRLGHSVEVLVSTYVGALKGTETVGNELIEQYLGEAAISLRP